MFELRGRGLECLGHVAVAIGAEHFAKYFEFGMQSAKQGLELNNPTLREHSFIYFANAAKVMTHAFDAHLPEMVPFLATVIREPELSPFEDAESKLAALGADDEDDEGDDDEGGQFLLNNADGFVDTKKAALTALGALAEHTGKAFYPYLESTLNEVILNEDGALNSYHRNVRSESLVILESMVYVACDHFSIPKAQKHQHIELPLQVAEVSRAVLLSYLTSLDDVEKLPVSSALIGICGVIEKIGVAGLNLHNLNKSSTIGDILVKKLLLFLQEKAPCQKISKHEGDEEEDDDDHDNEVMDSVCDCIGYMSKAVGPAFEIYYRTLHAPLLKFTKSGRPFTDRAMAIGCIAEVMQELNSASILSYLDSFIPVIEVSLQDTMEAVRRNAAFAIGVICFNGGPALAAHYLKFLQMLRPLCDRPAAQVVATDVGGADVDNALSAVAKMIQISSDSIPLQQVLPVIIAALPLRVDFDEALNVYGTLVKLMVAGNAHTISMLPQLLTCLVQILPPTSQVNDVVKALVVSGIKSFASNPQLQSAFASAYSQITDASIRTMLDMAINS